MGKIDLITRQYLSKPERFAQICNHVLFGGANILRPELLRELDVSERPLMMLEEYPESGRKTGAARKLKIGNRSRDLVKQYDGKTMILILGLESQSEICYTMPLRHMLYDALRYQSQCERLAKKHRRRKDWHDKGEFLTGISNSDRLSPVVTICVYWGRKILERTAKSSRNA